MRLALLALAACSGDWRPRVASSLDDPDARAVAFELADGDNGTEAVLALLAQAKHADAGAISGLEIQIGRCTRALAPAVVIVPSVAELGSNEVDAVTSRANETRYTCERSIEQIITSGSGSAGNLGDTELVDKDTCRRTPIAHVVTRYRFELDHHFTPPDLDEIARSAHVRLAYGAPRCGLEVKTEIRARFHRGKQPAVQAAVRTPPSAASIVELVKHARAAAVAKHPGEATSLAEQALALFGDGAVLAALDDAHANELAGWIAAAQFFAVEIQVDMFLRREQPRELDAAWADDIAADLDRIAKRYERIRDLVQLPVVEPQLRAGAGRLADLHVHVAELLDRGDQAQAAASERAKAKQLVEISTGAR